MFTSFKMLGALLNSVMPEMGNGAQASSDNPYFCHLGDCFGMIITSGLLTAESSRTLTNKLIYASLAEFPLPKVVREAPPGVDFGPVWERLYSPLLGADEKEITFLAIHNKLPVPERLFRIGMKKDPYCLHCPNAVVGDIEHFFCSCTRSVAAWQWLKGRLILLSTGATSTSNLEFLNLFLPRGTNQLVMLWLIGKFLQYVWNTIYVKENPVKVDKFIGYLKFKYKNDKVSSSVVLRSLDGILK